MEIVQYAGVSGQKVSYTLSPDMVVVRTKNVPTLKAAIRSLSAEHVVANFEKIAHFPHAGVEVLRTKVRSESQARIRRNEALRIFGEEKNVRFAGKVLQDRNSRNPVIYTENIFVKFKDNITINKGREILQEFSLLPKDRLRFSKNFWFASGKEGCGRSIFKICQTLLKDHHVELCHPELIRPVHRWAAAPEQWHLKETTVGGQLVKAHANVQAAWRLSKGQNVTIAVIDDGVDTSHPEFAGAGKVVMPRDVTRGLNSASPFYVTDNHGTCCAGVACGNGTDSPQRASGTAPLAKLMPIRTKSGLGAKQEADAFSWAARHGADIISCSWGPPDGDPKNPTPRDPVVLPDHTREAIRFAVEQGRGGKGCVITWAAGNGNTSIDDDGYSSNDMVITVAACNDRGKRSYYSNFGKAVLCCFPSNDRANPPPLTPGIWTTDRNGQYGYNPNEQGPDANQSYNEGFGGTSSACPGVAGVVALMLARNQALTWQEVKQILSQSCEQIARTEAHYDANGHSLKYGFGRVDAKKAVQLADAAGN